MIKLIDSEFDAEMGYSSATIQTKIGKFMGHAFIHPQDQEIQSRFFGCDLAEMRAYILYYKELLKRTNIELNTLYLLKKDYSSLSLDDPLNKRITQKENYKKDLQREINILKAIINERIKNYEMQKREIRRRFSDK